MKKFVKLISLLLVLFMMVAVFAACNKGEGPENNPSPSTNISDGEKDIEVINWDGLEYRILGKNSSSYMWAKHFEVWCEEGEMPEDVMGKAVWTRNQDMSENYGIEVVGYLDSSCNDLAKTAINSGEDLYDLILISPEAFNPFAVEGKLIDLYELDYINLEHDGWMDYPNKNLTMGGRLFYTTNKFLVQDKNRYWGVFYNRDMAAELNLGYFEDMVFDGTWTMDKVIEIAKIATFERNGENGLGKGDNWGVGCGEVYNIAQLFYGVGFRISDIDTSGYPYLIGATDDMISRLDKVFELVLNKEAFWCDERNGGVDWSDCACQMFERGEVLIQPIVLSELQIVGNAIDFKFGVLPNPKYNEKQEIYYTIPNLGNGSLLGVPITVCDVPFAGYALELITEKSVDTTYKAYIEVTCKLQKVQDEDAARCLEIIYNGVVYDLAFVCNLGGVAKLVYGTLAGSGQNLWARLYGRTEEKIQAAIKDIRDAYAALDNVQAQ